jgi:adenine C2-methylase RlmN of 23S rRNA A2503 and tRNA A37
MGMGEPLYNFDNVRDRAEAGDGRGRAGPVQVAASRCPPRAWCR